MFVSFSSRHANDLIGTSWRFWSTSKRSTSPEGSRSRRISGVVLSISDRAASTNSSFWEMIPIAARVVIAPRLSESSAILRIVSQDHQRAMSWRTHSGEKNEYLPFKKLIPCCISGLIAPNSPERLSCQNGDMPLRSFEVARTSSF